MNERRWWALVVVGLWLAQVDGAQAAEEVRLVGPAGSCLGAASAEGEARGVALAACTSDFGPVWQMPARGGVGEARFDGACLAIQGEALELSPVVLDSCDGGADQQWHHDTRGRLVGQGGLCLDGNPARLATCQEDVDRQIFMAEKPNGWSLSHFRDAYVGRLLPSPTPSVAYHRVDTISRSVDQGRTWVPLTQGSRLGLDQVVVDRQNADHLLGLENLSGKPLRSEDGGRSWRQVAGWGASDLHQSLHDPQVWYAVGKSGFWISRNGGKDFSAAAWGQAVGGEYPISFLDDAAGNWLMGLAEVSDCPIAYRSSQDQGATWQNSTGLPSTCGQTGLAPALLGHPAESGSFYALDGLGTVYRSQDAGRTFVATTQLSGYPSGLQLQGDEANAGRLWAVYDGLWRSDDRGTTWVSVLDAFLGDTDAVASLAFLGPETLLVQTVGRPLTLLSRDRGQTWELWGEDSPQGGLPTPLAAGRRRGLFFAGGATWRTFDYGRTWEFLGTDRRYLKVVPDPQITDQVYIFGEITTGPAFHRSIDNGRTLENMALPGNSQIQSLLANVVDGFVVLLALPVENSGRIWRSEDRGQSWTAVQVAPSRLRDFVSDGFLSYATTELGQFFSSDDGQTWSLSEVPAPRSLVAGAGKWAGFVGQELWIGTRTTVERLPWDVRAADDELQMDRLGRIFVRRGTGVQRSSDNGRTWQSLDLSANDLLYQLVDDAYDSNRVVAATKLGPLFGRFAEPTTVRVGQGRFTVRAHWRNAEGLEGEGTGANIGDDVVAFRFFSPERDEVVIKVLDGRAVNGHFWVFVGSMTNVAFEVEVVDTVSGERQVYQNPQGSLASFGDTLSFPSEGQEWAYAVTRPWFFPNNLTEVVKLGGDRFEIEVDWQTTAESGKGLGKALAGDTATFSFFSPENVELWVNVIDGRPLNGHYWVFVGSLSNVGFRIRIRDTETGAERFFDNAVGNFASFGDTSAF